MKDSKQLTIYDWDGTIQEFKCDSSIGMILKTLTTKINKSMLAHIIGDPNCVICTSRPKLYTWFIRLKCFMMYPSKIWFDGLKIVTINSNVFYDKNVRPELLDDDYERAMELMANIKMNHVEGLFKYVRHTEFDYIRYYDNEYPGITYCERDNRIFRKLAKTMNEYLERRKNADKRKER